MISYAPLWEMMENRGSNHIYAAIQGRDQQLYDPASESE